MSDYSNNDNGNINNNNINNNNSNNNNHKTAMIKITLIKMTIDMCMMIWYPICELENPWMCVKLWKTYTIFCLKVLRAVKQS